jgi:hypothetical protein
MLSKYKIPVMLDKKIAIKAINTQNTATESSIITARLALSASFTDSINHNSLL